MGNPIIVIVKGDPGTGKTQITNIITDNIPSNHIIKLNNATEASLFGKANILGPDYPDHKIFYLGDLGDKKAIEHTAPYRKYLRELTSDGTTTREIADTNKPTTGPRPILTETLTGYPTMIYSTVRDEELEAQETDRAIEITPNLSQFQKIKEIILFHEDPDAQITQKITKLQNEWTPKIQGIFEYLLKKPQKVLLPWDLTILHYGLRDTKTIASITRKIAMINQQSREQLDDYIIASPVDLVLALRYVQDGELERTRLQQVYDHYGLSRSFTRDDVGSLFPDSYTGVQASKRAYRYILRPATEDFDEEGIPVVYEDKDARPYNYYFRREPNKKVNFKIPPVDYSLIKKQYPTLSFKEENKINKEYVEAVIEKGEELMNFRNEQEFELDASRLAKIGMKRINPTQKRILNEFSAFHPTKYIELVNELLMTYIYSKKALNREMEDLIDKRILKPVGHTTPPMSEW
jgi:hypothetical protein